MFVESAINSWKRELIVWITISFSVSYPDIGSSRAIMLLNISNFFNKEIVLRVDCELIELNSMTVNSSEDNSALNIIE